MPSCKVLVVDDEKYLTFMLSMKLTERGAQVFTASNGSEAFSLACDHLPDLVVTDFQMPTMNGLELAQKLKLHGPTSHIPVLMLTARGHAVSNDQLSRTNIRQLISKPFSTKEFLATVAEFCAVEAQAGGSLAA
ncbi:MAG: response regulator [Pyrinomonadaceae bacterium]|nr:response regulator [Phycisphaerales bacterium]